jgi:hypothetical protein
MRSKKYTLLLSFREKFLTDVLYQKFCGRVPCAALRGRAMRCKSSLATQVAGFSLADTRVHTRYIHALGMRRVRSSAQAPKR